MRITTALTTIALLVATNGWCQTSVTVWLENGGILQGELVERSPEDHITLKLATGEVRRLAWSEVDHDSLSEKKLPPEKKPEAEPETEKPADEIEGIHKPNPKSKAVADYTPPDFRKAGAGAPVFVSGANGYFVQRLEGTISGSGYTSGGGRVVVSGEIWNTICVAPCNQALPPGTYRIDGEGIPSSSSFSLRGGEELEVSPGSIAGYVIGRGMFSIGVVSAPVGGILWGMERGRNSDETFGKTLFIGGAIALAVGLPLWLLSRTTVTVKEQSGLSLGPTGLSF